MLSKLLFYVNFIYVVLRLYLVIKKMRKKVSFMDTSHIPSINNLKDLEEAKKFDYILNNFIIDNIFFPGFPASMDKNEGNVYMMNLFCIALAYKKDIGHLNSLIVEGLLQAITKKSRICSHVIPKILSNSSENRYIESDSLRELVSFLYMLIFIKENYDFIDGIDNKLFDRLLNIIKNKYYNYDKIKHYDIKISAKTTPVEVLTLLLLAKLFATPNEYMKLFKFFKIYLNHLHYIAIEEPHLIFMLLASLLMLTPYNKNASEQYDFYSKVLNNLYDLHKNDYFVSAIARPYLFIKDIFIPLLFDYRYIVFSEYNIYSNADYFIIKGILND